jgi:hypothetical protein
VGGAVGWGGGGRARSFPGRSGSGCNADGLSWRQQGRPSRLGLVTVGGLAESRCSLP